MSRTSLATFLEGAAQAQTGYMQGHEAGRQARISQDVQQYQLARQAEQEQRANELAPLNPALEHLGLLSTEGQLGALQAAAEIRARQGAPTYTGALLPDIFRGKGLPPPATTTTLPGQPLQETPRPLAPPPSGIARTPVDMAAAAMGTGPVPGVTTPPPVAPPTLNIAAGGKMYHLPFGGGVPKEFAGQATARLKAVNAIRANLPTGSAVAAQIDAALAPGGVPLNLNPRTEQEAEETRRRLFMAEQATAGAGVQGRGLDARAKAAAAVALPKDVKELSTFFNQLPQGDPSSYIDGLRKALQASDSLEAAGKAAGKVVLPPAQLVASRGEIQRILNLADSEDPVDNAEAQKAATALLARVKQNFTPAQETAKLNAFLKYTARFSAQDKNFDAEMEQAARKFRVDHIVTPDENGHYNMGGASLDRAWSSGISRVIASAGLDPKTQRLALNNMRLIAKAKGLDQNQIPQQVFKELNPLQRQQLSKEIREASVWESAQLRKQADDERTQTEFENRQRALAATPKNTQLGGMKTLLEEKYRHWKDIHADIQKRFYTEAGAHDEEAAPNAPVYPAPGAFFDQKTRDYWAQRFREQANAFREYQTIRHRVEGALQSSTNAPGARQAPSTQRGSSGPAPGRAAVDTARQLQDINMKRARQGKEPISAAALRQALQEQQQRQPHRR